MIYILSNILQYLIAAVGLFVIVYSIGERKVPHGALELISIIGFGLVMIIWFG